MNNVNNNKIFPFCVPTGSWGKRSPVDYINEYATPYGDNDNYKAYIFPPGKRRHVFCFFV